ncbi:hypothetical protein BY458DRAFT_515088 [Sporodiniella umbellata]|nr:hypothetical protein BY458DRAFT_515088 [Sporodiniella umbellata]
MLPRSGHMSKAFDMSTVRTSFQEPPSDPNRERHFGLKEAPTFYPTAEEFQDPMAYIDKISIEGAKFGIAKIIPPADYKPEFALNSEAFRFRTRVQKLNSLEGGTRSSLNYMDQLTKFRLISGKPAVKVPLLDKKPIDLYKLKKEVAARGGVEQVTQQKKWAEIGRELGYARKNCTSMSNSLKSAYIKLILPYEVWYTQHKDDAEALLKKNDITHLNNDVNDTCEICLKSQDEANLLLCDGCNRGYHLYCLTPALNSVPKTDWFCFQCLTAVGKDYGFEDGPEYTLAEFQEFSNNFKKEWFSKNEGLVTEDQCESEFWRLANNPHETCEVEYGADLHSTQHGSGFIHPEQNFRQTQFDPWNLNVLPVAPQSLFTHINTDISGMMVPWLYIGMCFSAFCWHNEDHYTYSINYMHWGETKTWYGIPGSDTDKFEATMKKAMPELFNQHPDLLFQLVTMYSPEQLSKENVDVYAVDQRPGQFVITFPKAYHSGFNHGFNFCEAVNFAPLKWIDHGLECAKLYKEYRRQPCFSHDALLVTAALNVKSCYQNDMDWLKQGITDMYEREIRERKMVRTRHLKEVLLPEEDPREEMQCDHCHCYTYLSFISCACTDKVSCSEHTIHLCVCPTSSKTLYLRYTDDELQNLVDDTLGCNDAQEQWMQKVCRVMESKPALEALSKLYKEGQEVGASQESLSSFRDFIHVIETWTKEAGRVLGLVPDSNKASSKPRIERIEALLREQKTIAYDLPHIPRLNEYLGQLTAYDETITEELLTSGNKQVQEIIYEHGKQLRADSQKIVQLRSEIESYAWSEQVEKVLAKPFNVKAFKKLIKTASNFGIYEGPWLHRLTTIEQEARDALQFIDNLCRGKQKIDVEQEQEVFHIGQNVQNPSLSFTLEPHLITRLENRIRRSKSILKSVQDFLSQCSRTNVLERPTVEEGQKMIVLIKESVFNSPIFQELSQGLSALSNWTEKVRTTFMHGRHKSLEHVLQETLLNVERVTSGFDVPDVYCFCRKPEHGMMVACDTCKEWYHDVCVKLPRGVARSTTSYVCPICTGDEYKPNLHSFSRQPSLEEIKELIDFAQQSKFLPKNYETISSIYSCMQTFEGRVQAFLSHYQDKKVIQKYIRCLEGLEVRLPQQTQALKAKLAKTYQEGPHHKLSISSLLHPIETPYNPMSYASVSSSPYQEIHNTTPHSISQGQKRSFHDDQQGHTRIQKLRLTVKTPPSQHR